MHVQRTFERNRVPPLVSLLVGSCLLIAATVQYTTLPVTFGYSLVLGAYLLILGVFIRFTSPVITGKRVYFGLYLLLSSIALLSTLANTTLGTSVRLVGLLFFTSANFFVVPRVISFHQFLYLTSRITAVLVLIGVLPYLGFPANLFFVDISGWGSGVYWFPALEVITSIFDNPNTLGFLTLVGAIAALGEWMTAHSRSSLALFLIAIGGLSLTNNRSGWIAFLIAMALFGMYQVGGRDYLLASLISGLSFTSLMLLLLFGLIPGPESLTELSLNGRWQLWIAGVDALLEKPLLGQGLEYGGTHNSYIRMFGALGVGGGVIYLALSIATVIQSARNITSQSGLIVTITLVAFVYVQLFEGVGYIGLSLHSIIIAVMMGYHITGTIAEEPA